MKLHDVRTEYKSQTLNKDDVAKNPIAQFEAWMKQAMDAGIDDVNAFALATVNESNKPSVRIVLLKEVNDYGFVFFTNYLSNKGVQRAENSAVAINFYWAALERQVRIEGKVEKISDEDSDDYFNSRPRESQLGAWASPQSSIIHNRPVLDSRVEFYAEKFKNKTIPRPPQWGGYLVKPTTVEFWQGRASRLHDRLLYDWMDGHWVIERLAP
jgi:pyridoxamine 5'-phosphate oxidase